MTWATYLAVVCPLIAAAAYVIAAGGYWWRGDPWMASAFLFWACANVGLIGSALR